MKVRMIYLAAGNSRRFGENKLFFPVEEKEMYRHLLERLLRIVGRHEDWELFVVSQYEELLEGAGKLWEEQQKLWDHRPKNGWQKRLHRVFSPESRLGISYSIRAGIEAEPVQRLESVREPGAAQALKPTAIPDAYAFFAADQPYLSEQTAEGFLMAMEQKKAALGAVEHGGELGNPAWFSADYRQELLELSGDQGGKRILKAHPAKVVSYPVADGRELSDIDVKVK